MMHAPQDVALGDGVLYSVVLNNSALIQNFHGIDPACVLLLHLHHLAKIASSEYRQIMEIVGYQFILFQEK